MRNSRLVMVLVLALATGLAFFWNADRSMLGFDGQNQDRQKALEANFESKLNRANIEQWIKKLSARPHHVGSPYGKENAEFIAAQFSSWGYDTKIEEFQVLFPTPKTRLLEMTAPTRFTARLAEPALEKDSTSGQVKEQLPVYNAYSIDGDVTAELVYVNYGVPSDYEELARHGIDVKGKIAIARYGGSWRGIKPKVAAENGAIGCIIYSDPRDDGYFQGEVYPEGAFRGDLGAQRGSVADMPLYPGDPLTPGVGATKDAKRLDVKEAKTLTKIPVLPISYADALPLLKALKGPVAPPSWRGALPVTYHLGPGPAKVHLQVAFNWDLAPAYNVIARMKGKTLPDEWIIRGNHHDAWVNGASDPISGMAPMMEEARAIAELAKTGWAPDRTIIYAAWDAEEPGLLGSTEWVEAHADELREKAAVYINSDSNGRGFLSVGGSHTLEKFINQVARDVKDPQKNVSVWERSRALQLVEGSAAERKELRSRDDLRISALGSGSDYTPFLQHLGIASLNIGFGGESEGGSYHSIYDSFDHYSRFGDPGFHYGVAQAATTGRAVLRLANAMVLPFEFTNFADTLDNYVDEVTRLADTTRVDTEEENLRLKEGLYELAADPTQEYRAPKAADPMPFLNFAPLQNALSRVQQSAGLYQKALQKMQENGKDLPTAERRKVDQFLIQTERAMTSSQGLPRRPWYVHQIYAPGFYTGYGVKTLPGVREAIEQRNWKEAQEQIQRTAEALEKAGSIVEQAAHALQG